MKFFLSSFGFLLTLIAGVLAFAFTAIEFPATMRELLHAGEALRSQLSTLGIPDTYMVWIDILLGGDKLVLLGFIILARLIFGILVSIFSPFPSADRRMADYADSSSRSLRPSPFDRWGRAS